MAAMSRTELLAYEIDDRSIHDWETGWELLAGGFGKDHPELKRYIGLARAVLDREVMYILRAAEHSGGGLAKGLKRISGPPQTGNDDYGAKMIRDNIKSLELEVLIVGTDESSVESVATLKRLMIKLHDPLWNRPHNRRMLPGSVNNKDGRKSGVLLR